MADEKHPGGRKPKLTPGWIKKFVKYIRQGTPAKIACMACGVDESTYYRWLREARDGQNDLAVRLAAEVEKAEPEFEAAVLRRIYAAADHPRSWQAGAWLLERKFPDRYGKTVMVKHQVERELSKALDLLKERLNADEYTRVLEAVAELTDGDAGPVAPSDDPLH